MEEAVRFMLENRERILAVESSFGPWGRPLAEPGRVLVGEGRLLKLSRRRPQPKAFFLFDDLLVYGGVVVPGRRNSHQRVVRLEEVKQEDLRDGPDGRHRWLIRTPRKSFYVAAASDEEKRAWMERIEEGRSRRIRRLGLPPDGPLEEELAVAWIPDEASAVCMRCSRSFSTTNRRHHCRLCGFLVCGSCSGSRALLGHIHKKKPVRVCSRCKGHLEAREREERERKRDSTDEEAPEYEVSSEDEEQNQVLQEPPEDDHSAPTRWFSQAEYCYLDPAHAQPPRI